MFGIFKKKKKADPDTPMVDINQNPLLDGDMVISLRYDMGLCKVLETEQGLVYESVETGKQENWTRMIDASTTFQKVEKVKDDQSLTK
ncbi:MAG: hypothetical protein O2887_07820 [Bacteroidetes bacterium]|nr:hypothetical protein [Bacteroidota bacterium]MDA1120387.1 hypothetical protein [Bacteroidota bacterium]